MSTEIITSLSFKEDGTISGSYYSSNVHPKTPCRIHLSHASPDVALRDFLNDLNGGLIRISTSANNYGWHHVFRQLGTEMNVKNLSIENISDSFQATKAVFDYEKRLSSLYKKLTCYASVNGCYLTEGFRSNKKTYGSSSLKQLAYQSSFAKALAFRSSFKESILFLSDESKAFISESLSEQEQLFIFIEANDIDSIEKLISQGVDINCKDSIGRTPLMRASRVNFEMVSRLIELGADAKGVDRFGRSFIYYGIGLHGALRVLKDEQVSSLIGSIGLDVLRKDIFGLSEAHYLIQNRTRLLGGLLQTAKSDVEKEELCLTGCTASWACIDSIPEELQSKEVVDAAIESDPVAIKYVANPSEEQCIKAASKNSLAFKLIKKKNLNICLAAVSNSGDALQNVDKKFQTIELCVAAIKNDYRSYRFIDEDVKTPELIWKLFETDELVESMMSEKDIDKLYRYRDQMEEQTSVDRMDDLNNVFGM